MIRVKKRWHLLLSIFFSLLAQSSPVTVLPLRNVRTYPASLYSESDKVVLLNVTNFEPTIANKPYIWLVEFYANWCGHCRNFAPVWKELARDVYDWRNVIQIAAIDCAVKENAPTCRDQSIIGYPSLKFFTPQVNDTSFGITWDGYIPRTVEGLRGGMIEFLEIQLEAGIISKPVLQILPETYDFEDLWIMFTTHDKVILLFEEPGSGFWSREAILDLSANVNLPPIRRVSSYGEKLVKRFQITKYPSLILAWRNGRHRVLSLDSPRSIFQHVVRGIVGQDLLLNEWELTTTTAIPTNLNGSEALTLKPHKINQNVAYMSDLEKAIHYSLTHEVVLHKELKGNKLAALTNYLIILKNYFPTRFQLKSFLDELLAWIEQHPTGVTGEEYQVYVTYLSEQYMKDWPVELENWKGCRGSQPQFRGYPCGLWSLFHTLTVGGWRAKDPLEVLHGIRGYVAMFFSCVECSQHFLRMAYEDGMDFVNTYKESIIWLWNAHNKANKRLAGQPNEDPLYPKIEFPDSRSCPTCRDDLGNFDYQEVVRFLQTMYWENIDWTGIGNTNSAPRNGQ